MNLTSLACVSSRNSATVLPVHTLVLARGIPYSIDEQSSTLDLMAIMSLERETKIAVALSVARFVIIEELSGLSMEEPASESYDAFFLPRR